MGMKLTVTADAPVRDEGTILVFTGEHRDGRKVTFGVDRSIGLDLYGYLADTGSVDVEVEPWQILGRVA